MTSPTLPDKRNKNIKIFIDGVLYPREQAKVSVRNIRRDSIHDLKECLNEKMISEDDCHKGQSDVQTITDQMIQNIETLSSGKQKELMTI